MTTVHQPVPTATVPAPFAIYEDKSGPELSEVEVYDGEESFHSEVSLSGAEDVIPSIEVYGQDPMHEQDSDDEPPEEPRPYSSSYTTRPPPSILTSARRMSAVTSTSFISSIPSEMSISSKHVQPSGHGVDGTKYSPRKERPLFRNPASVRAMQMSSPPPFQPSFTNSHPHDRMKGAYKFMTPSRSGRSDTSRRSQGSHRGVPHKTSQEYLLAPRERSPRPTTAPHPTSTSHYSQSQSSQNLPLVLLHVTILPMQSPYSHELMVKTMPAWLVQNYKLLDEKLHDVVLMRRGLLIPHPHDEYDLLEERILESLELKMPRLSKCGHFVTLADEDDEDEGSENEEEDTERSFHADEEEDRYGRDTSMSGGTITGEEETEAGELCADCHRPVRKPGKGIGAGTKKWDIKIYAANGLMRAGAWAAAWREMERCDVEIAPWIPEDVKLELEKRAEEEEEAERQKMLYDAELQRLAHEEASRAKQLEAEAKEKKMQDELWERLEVERQIKAEEDKAKETKFNQTLHEKIEEVKEVIRLEFETQALVESDIVAERFRALEDKIQSLEQTATELALVTASDPPVAAVSELPRQRSPSRRRSLSRPRSSRRQTQQADPIPLGQALKNYFLLLAWEQKNLLIVIFTGLLAYFVMNPDLGQHISMPSLPGLPTVRFENSLPVSPVVASVTDTATLTTTEIATATTTVTHVAYQTIEILLPASTPSDASSAAPHVQEVHDVELGQRESKDTQQIVGNTDVETPQQLQSNQAAARNTNVPDVEQVAVVVEEAAHSHSPSDPAETPSVEVEMEVEAETEVPASPEINSDAWSTTGIENELQDSLDTPSPETVLSNADGSETPVSADNQHPSLEVEPPATIAEAHLDEHLAMITEEVPQHISTAEPETCPAEKQPVITLEYLSTPVSQMHIQKEKVDLGTCTTAPANPFRSPAF